VENKLTFFIDRKKNNFCILIILLIIISFLCISCQNDDSKAGTIPPNIIFILADDLGYGDLSCYGQTKFQTPHIDRLAKNGIRFLAHYAGSTVCAPSRSSLMTGLHTGHTPIRGNREVKPEGQHPLPANTVTIAKLMQKAGYVTGAFGKWGLGYPSSEGDPNNQGFDEFFGYNCQRFGHHYYPHHLWQNQDRIIIEENSGTSEVIYGPDLIHEKTLQFITENKDRPFFLFVPSIIPHAELYAPEKYMNKHRGKYGDEEPYKGADAKHPNYRAGPYGSQPEPKTAFAAMVNILDDQVGEIVDTLRTLGLLENTIIIFSSDNGPHLEGGADPDYFDSNSKFKGYKRDLYDGGLRVPMIVSWPDKFQSNYTTNHISAFWDILPTVCDIAGIKTPANLDGISFLPVLLGKGQQKTHAYLYWEFYEWGGKQAVRMGKWKGIRTNVIEHRLGPLELYDLYSDPGENKNLAKENPKIVQQISELMKKAHTPSEIFKFE
jgi:arylsulfatase A-like enzyme